MKNLKIRTMAGLVSAILFAALLVGITSTIISTGGVRDLGKVWTAFETGAAQKSEHVLELERALGYGGMIHHFKNYVLRKDQDRIAKIDSHARDAKLSVAAYRALGVDEHERAALLEIDSVVDAYLRAVDVTKKMASEGRTSNEIDTAVKVDDSRALVAIQTLRDEQSDARKTSSQNIRAAVQWINSIAWTSGIAVTVILIAAIGLFIWITNFRMLPPLANISTAMTRLAAGDTGHEVTESDRADEIGDLARVFEAFKQNIIASVEKANEAFRIQAALDSARTNIMVADTDYKIVYMNQTMVEMFRKAESDIRKDLSRFNVDKLIGANIDEFHKNVGHQRAILDNLTSQYVARIKIGGRTFSLASMPVINRDGQRLGTVVEWMDMSERLRLEDAVNAMARGVANGELNRRLESGVDDEFIDRLAESMNNLANSVEGTMDDVGESLEALAEGRLDRVIDNQYGGTFGILAGNANATIERLREIVTTISQASFEIANAAREIAAGSLDLSQRTEQQAANLESTAASMEEVAATVSQNAANAGDANTYAIKTREVADTGRNIVVQAISAMSEIESSSQSISDIIGVIDEIAFQTNLLALNAAVEAARAGDAGKGFAVVASEVGKLARRSSDAAKEIKGLILSSGNQVKRGVELVKGTGEALAEIVESVNSVADVIAEIAIASKEQATSIQEVNAAVTKMDEMTQQNSAIVEESTAATRALEDQAQYLTESVSFFSVPGLTQDSGNPVLKRGPAKPTQRNRATPARETPRHGSETDDDWEEF